MLFSIPPPNTLHYHPAILLASSIIGETLGVWWVPPKWSSSRLLRSFPPPSLYPSSVASQGGGGVWMSLLSPLSAFVTRHCLRLLSNPRLIARAKLPAGDPEFPPRAPPLHCQGPRRRRPCLAGLGVSDRAGGAGSECKRTWHPSCVRRANYTDVGSGPRGPVAQRKDAMQALGARAALQRKPGNSST